MIFGKAAAAVLGKWRKKNEKNFEKTHAGSARRPRIAKQIKIS